MGFRELVRSAGVALAGTVVSLSATVLSKGALIPLFDELASGMLWAVPLTLAVSVAMFNNMFRVYDRLEKVVEEFGNREQRPAEDDLDEAITETDKLTAGLLGNAFISIVAGIAYLTIRGLRSVPTPGPLRDIVPLDPVAVAVSVEFGLAVLVVVILVNQFRSITPLVEFYRFFAVDRHRLRGSSSVVTDRPVTSIDSREPEHLGTSNK